MLVEQKSDYDIGEGRDLQLEISASSIQRQSSHVGKS